jgi:hypothetical protein
VYSQGSLPAGLQQKVQLVDTHGQARGYLLHILLLVAGRTSQCMFGGAKNHSRTFWRIDTRIETPITLERYGAGGENRTPTGLPPPDFESGASASSTTPALLLTRCPIVYKNFKRRIQNSAVRSQKGSGTGFPQLALLTDSEYRINILMIGLAEVTPPAPY